MMTKQVKFKVDTELYPFQSRWISLNNGAAIHYVDEGKGPILLLLHGNPTWSFLYRHIILGLKDRFRCIAPDYPGFGLSTAQSEYGFMAAEHADVMAGFIEALDLRDISIMMQDWGGPIGFSVALRHPDRVQGLIIGNTWAWPLERFGQKMFSRIMGGPVGRTLAWCCNGIVRFFMSKGVRNGLDKRTLNMYLLPFIDRNDRSPTHVFPYQLRAAHSFLAGIYQGLPALSNKPALILWGQKDFAFKAPERLRFEDIFANHKTILLPDAGHFIQEDAPDEIVRAVQQWFAEEMNTIKNKIA